VTRALRRAARLALLVTVGVYGPARAPLAAQGPGVRQDSTTPGARCPERFTPIRDSTSNTLRCRRDEVRWVVTTCADSAYATYRAQPGADVCLPTSLPGVGSAPGVHGTLTVVCAGGVTGYPVVRDRIGDRDRCERAHQTFAAPVRAAAGRSSS
jgi:hypothetical protein